MDSSTSGPRFFKPAAKPRPASGRELQVRIERLSDEGRGIGFAQGKTIFVPNTLVGETVQVRILDERRHTAEAEMLALVEAAPNRTAPHCALFGRCGGCQLQVLDVEAQLRHKRQVLAHLLAPFANAKNFQWADPVVAAPWGYRHRARLSVADSQGSPVVGFKGMHSHRVVAVSSCPILDDRLQALLQSLPEWLAQLGHWRRVEELLVAVDSDGRLAVDWIAQRAFPKVDADAMARLLRSAGIEVGPDVDLRYRNPQTGSEFYYRMRDFTQINPAVNDALIQRVLDWLAPATEDVVADLFCGLGNFSLPLARRVGQLEGFESSLGMIERAGRNAGGGFANTHFTMLDLFEQADQLPDRYNKILLDPPRAGAKAACVRLATFKQLRHIVYVSCNPQTLVRDLEILRDGGFVLERAALVDMFPQTGHVETIVKLSRV